MPGYGRKYTKRTMRKRRTYSRKPSKAVKRYVKQAIHRQIENKVKTLYLANDPVPTAVLGATAPYSKNMFMAIAEGADNGERNGNRVTPRSNTFTAYINLRPHDATLNPDFPIMVRMWVCKLKSRSANVATLPSSDFDDFFELGDLYTGFQGNMLDMLLPVNKDKWIVYEERTFKLGVGQNAGAYSGGNNALDNSSFNRKIIFHCGKHWKLPLDYTNSSADRPANTNLWIVVQAVAANGTSVIGPTCEIHYAHKFVYEDA